MGDGFLEADEVPHVGGEGVRATLEGFVGAVGGAVHAHPCGEQPEDEAFVEGAWGVVLIKTLQVMYHGRDLDIEAVAVRGSPGPPAAFQQLMEDSQSPSANAVGGPEEILPVLVDGEVGVLPDLYGLLPVRHWSAAMVGLGYFDI